MLYIFDWDGTLSNSLERIVMSMERAFIDANLSVPDVGARKSMIGLGLTEAFAALLPNDDEDLVQSLCGYYRDHYLALDGEIPSPLFDGTMEVLHTLKQRGHQLAVATGKRRRGLDRILSHMDLEDFFDSSRCADETRSKPHPQMLEEILIETSVPASNALMIGDTDFDILMAKSAGMRAIAVSYGAHSLERLSRSKPDKMINQLTELLEPELLACTSSE